MISRINIFKVHKNPQNPQNFLSLKVNYPMVVMDFSIVLVTVQNVEVLGILFHDCLGNTAVQSMSILLCHQECVYMLFSIG